MLNVPVNSYGNVGTLSQFRWALPKLRIMKCFKSNHSTKPTMLKNPHGNKFGNTYDNVNTNFGLHISFFVKNMNKKELRSLKSSEHINDKRDEPYHGFGYLSLFSDPLAPWQNGAKQKYCDFAIFNRVVVIIQKEQNK